jgi:hypothetical protein
MSAAALSLAACGGDEEVQTRTIVETVTVEAPPASAGAQPPPTAQDTPAGEPLPPGVVAADGTYAMETKDTDFVNSNTTVDDRFPTGSEWDFTTTCTGPECTVEMRRELQSGGYKTLMLMPVEDREGVFEVESTGTTECAIGSEEPPTDQRYSLKLNAPEDVGGRQTATRIEVYFTEETEGCTDDGARGMVSWTGVLQR